MKYSSLLIELKKKMSVNKMEESIATIIIKDLLGENYYFYLQDEVSVNDLHKVNNILERLLKGEPIQYILGYTYFYGLKIIVDKNVLIPRNETEELVELLLESINDKDITIVDIGTGSGCIALAIKKHRPNWNVIGVDISKEALCIAKKNSQSLGLDVNFLESNLLENIDSDVDVIISNPPYIDVLDKEVDTQTLLYEPHLALFAEENGLLFYKKYKDICIQRNIKELFIEFGYKQAKDIKEIFHDYKIEIKKDLNKNDRMARITF